MDRAQKAEVVAGLQQTLSETESIIVVQNNGLTVAQVTELRNNMRQEGVHYKVYKNRLALRALEGTRFEGIGPMLKGPTALATSQDPVAAAKVACDFAKKNEQFAVLGGALGEKTLDVSGVEALSKLPSLDEIRASLLRMIQTPATRMATLTQKPAEQLARVLKAYSEKEAA